MHSGNKRKESVMPEVLFDLESMVKGYGKMSLSDKQYSYLVDIADTYPYIRTKKWLCVFFVCERANY